MLVGNGNRELVVLPSGYAEKSSNVKGDGDAELVSGPIYLGNSSS